MPQQIEARGDAAAAPTETRLLQNLPTLAIGQVSEGVRFLQQILILRYGYNIAFDANFGSQTQQAVKDFQSKHNLVVDGIVGINTWRALGANIGC
ncbi:peptidoglycan-binding domain-containing protein [Fischerella sp. PCC 9605]|uniref:peptidoglycan-binding domain-containing protein n=1 Tax=Fischerella sp. PCC 9605 TaxID=1173024 RepID=UPI0004B86E61|nr:peptidoglycan-binding domain-containing protein [Fischerella sp. PCC 9605]